MTQEYAGTIEQVTTVLTEAILTVESDLLMSPLELDQPVRAVLRQVGLAVMQSLLERLSMEVTVQAAGSDEALTIQRRDVITVDTVFGTVEVPSPYCGVRGSRYALSRHSWGCDIGSAAVPSNER